MMNESEVFFDSAVGIPSPDFGHISQPYFGVPIFQPGHSDLNLFHSANDVPPVEPGVSKNSDNRTEVHSGELGR